jgi:type II secretory pathway predicted ATPase ExeA
MYEKHFGLVRRPFAITAEVATYYPATQQEQVFDQLVQAFQGQAGFAVLTGAAGTGKTLLALRLLEHERPHYLVLWIGHDHGADRRALLQALLYDLDLPYQDRSEQELRLALTDHILQAYRQGRPTLLIVDEAQHLAPPLLEELRLLSNLETRQGKAIQVLLVGQPDLLDTLRQPELAGLCQRVGLWARLAGLDVPEAMDYVRYHLRTAGGRPERILGDEALETLARSTGGVPRLLNQVTQRALQLAHMVGEARVDVEAVLEALSDWGLSEVMAHEPDEPFVPTPPADAEEILALNADSAEPTTLRAAVGRIEYRVDSGKHPA